ncbi:hypothetical protein [Sphingomonas cavernae]|uniref:DUF3325 domain-containing protein n=1 Tax=Sphingomonas cavernae TaxID=2320861 RepID=A0A418WKQ0_9SPHN|nr:hypothetical protein [Sphingomonas cavernae]RJF90614.1 hypothetical protein D3876_10345 [Sphingomonas cavernae]
MMMLVFAAIVFSTILIVMLCYGDPKRRRAASLPGEGHGAGSRRLLAAAACLPGLLWALWGDSAAFLVWLGGCAAAGWIVALWFSRAREDAG